MLPPKKDTVTQKIHHHRVLRQDPLSAPQEIVNELPATPADLDFVNTARERIQSALLGGDKRLVLILGPCSIHDSASALEYADRLSHLQKRVEDQFILVMRVYFEKPRTTVGWKGYITDPNLDGTDDMESGLRRARELLLKITRMGLPCATEFLDPIVPPYITDLISWAAIGARTTESQTHRQMASGLSMPVGFKNATDGSIQSALNSLLSARQPHSFLGIDPNGRTAVVRTSGNPDVHLVLRGSEDQPNYSAPHVAFAQASIGESGPARPIMVDCSHGNSRKNFKKQLDVFDDVLEQYSAGNQRILGMMIESHLNEGNQKLGGDKLKYGVSLTDACLSWEATEQLIVGATETLRRSAGLTRLQFLYAPGEAP